MPGFLENMKDIISNKIEETVSSLNHPKIQQRDLDQNEKSQHTGTDINNIKALDDCVDMFVFREIIYRTDCY